MASMLHPLLALTGLIVYTTIEVRGQELPPCELARVIPCINAAIESYVRNTVPENPEEALLNPQVTVKVATVLGAGLRDPKSDINATCQVLENIDTDAMRVCLEKESKQCVIQPPAGRITDLLPSLAGLTILDSAVLAPALCSTECKNYPLAESADNINTCLKASTEVLQAVATADNITEEHCRVLEAYIYCTWNNSVGCQFLEETSRDYLRTLEEAASICPVVFPPGVLPTPNPTPTPIITSKGVNILPEPFYTLILAATFLFWSSIKYLI